MTCNKCGHKFALSIDTSPGVFMAGSMFFFVIGLVLQGLNVDIWPYFFFGLAGFVALQAEVNRSDYSAYQDDGRSRTKCTNCKAPIAVKLWSF